MPSRKSYVFQKQWKGYKKNLPHWAVSLEPSKLAFNFIIFLKKYHVTEGKILEIGCGNGRDSFFFARQGFNVTAIDIAPEAINLCKKKQADFIRKRKIKKSQIKFSVANTERLPFENWSFICAYSIGVFHSTDLRKSLKELARVVKKEGLVIIHLFEKTVFLPSKKVETDYSSGEIKSILAKLPFQILKFKSNITKRKPDYDEETGFHKHFSIILYLKRTK